MTDTITIIGTVGTVVTSRRTDSGISIATFRMASSQRRYDRTSSTWVDGEANWFSVTAFRQLADNAAISLTKGDRIIVSGRLQVRSWERDGKSGIAVEIVAESIGPDLLFGTTTFTKSPKAAGPAQGLQNGALEGAGLQSGGSLGGDAPGGDQHGSGLQDRGASDTPSAAAQPLTPGWGPLSPGSAPDGPGAAGSEELVPAGAQQTWSASGDEPETPF